MDPTTLTFSDPGGDFYLVLYVPQNARTDSSGDTEMLDRAALPHRKLWFWVDSKKMRRALPNFQAVIDEGDSNPYQRPREIELLYLRFFRPYAVRIVLNIIHGRDDLVPKRLDHHMRLDVARVVYHFQCSEVVAAFSRKWCEGIIENRSALLRENARRALELLFMAMAFQHDFNFFFMSTVIVCHSRGVPLDSDIPLPRDLLRDLNNQRQRSLNRLSSILRAFVKMARDGDNSITRCKRHHEYLNIYLPWLQSRLDPPYGRISLENTKNIVTRMSEQCHWAAPPLASQGQRTCDTWTKAIEAQRTFELMDRGFKLLPSGAWVAVPGQGWRVIRAVNPVNQTNASRWEEARARILGA